MLFLIPYCDAYAPVILLYFGPFMLTLVRLYYFRFVWIPCPRTNTPRENVETPSVLQTSFLEDMLGNSGDCHVWKLATDPSPPHSTDGSSAADISPGRFSRRDFGKPRWMVL